MNKQVIEYSYNRDDLECGIFHIGVGNFHRAHEQFYTNMLLKDPSQNKWAICGGMLLPSDKKLYETLKQQQNEYTLTVCGNDDSIEVYRIGSLKELIWAIEDSESLINKIADPAIKIITLTITEGGYNINKQSGKFIFDTPAIQNDLNRENLPQTVFGFVAEGLRRRKKLSGSPITILSCDNLQHNGNTAKKAFSSFINKQDVQLAEWVEKNVTFPNSMVDRITPVTTAEDIDRLNVQNGTSDQAPVYCEDFIQWVIEDNFIAGRPAWENVGAEFTTDVSQYENMKLSLLNASHTLLSYPSYLSGYRKVDESMTDKRIRQYIKTFMDVDITPYVPAPGNTNLDEYKQTLVSRFANRLVSDQVSRLCFDGVSKFPVYIMPNLIKMIADKKNLIRLTYLFAAYRSYLKYKTDDQGVKFEINEPWLTAEDKEKVDSENPLDFLSLSAFNSTNLNNSIDFVNSYLEMVNKITNKGAMQTLESILDQ